ncbi:futalosine hydrolase [Catenuloplanes japonicus]|uniref:futalosine hydrolase n=1 Tax=Catenuloplanes japonicus TaxID=33876 RepID=UPI0038BA0119
MKTGFAVDPGERPAVTAGHLKDGVDADESSTVTDGHLEDGVDTQIVVAAVGVGPAEAAAGTARLLALAEAAGRPYASVISAGIGGGLAGRAAIGDTVIGTRSVAADLGADSPDGYLPIEELGFGSSVVITDDGLTTLLRDSLPDALAGDVLTVNTVTGTADRADALAGRHPSAIAEAMEGYGVAVAARAAGVAFAELRTISNPVGPRDRAAWNLPAAFTALTAAFAALTSGPDSGPQSA